MIRAGGSFLFRVRKCRESAFFLILSHVQNVRATQLSYAHFGSKLGELSLFLLHAFWKPIVLSFMNAGAEKIEITNSQVRSKFKFVISRIFLKNTSNSKLKLSARNSSQKVKINERK